MTPEQAAALRAPFPPETIGKLPKPYKKDSPKGNCKECGGYHGLPAAHLDYCGHAAVTDRLLAVDPEWSWEPQARDEHGLPLFDKIGGLWIFLTVCGVKRPGYGDATMGHGVKEVIGDAIRNAAMRFGVALDLWSKEDLQPLREEGENQIAKLDPGTRKTTEPSGNNGSDRKAVDKPKNRPPPAQPVDPKLLEDAQAAVRAALEEAALSTEDVDSYVSTHYRRQDRSFFGSLGEMDVRNLAHLRGQLRSGAVAEWLIKRSSSKAPGHG